MFTKTSTGIFIQNNNNNIILIFLIHRNILSVIDVVYNLHKKLNAYVNYAIYTLPPPVFKHL